MAPASRIKTEHLSCDLDAKLQLRRSARRTVSIQVARDLVLLRVPMRMSEARVLALIERRRDWIERKLKEIRQRPAPPRHDYNDGAWLPWRGHALQLRIKPGRFQPAQKDGDQLLLQLPSGRQDRDTVRRAVLRFYRSTAEQLLRQSTEHWSTITGRRPKGVRVRDYRARWGSCNARGELSFNYRLLLAPVEVSNYVVVHELCHLHHLNHSRAFWDRVQQAMPDYRRRWAWLRENGASLVL